MSNPEVIERVLEDYTTAAISEPLRATLAVLRKMTLEPEQLTAADVRTALATGVTRDALKEAMHVAYLFNIYDRLADSMGWDVPDVATGYYKSAARRLAKHGYV